MVRKTGELVVLNVARDPFEQERLKELDSFHVLDTRPEETFDSITRIAQTALDMPIVLVSLVDKERQWFKSRQGLELEQTPRNISFCAHAIKSDGVFVVKNAAVDPMFKFNPLVTDDPNIRFYAGAPLKTQNGHRVGTLCAMDRVPRGFPEAAEDTLVDLASLAVRELEIRKIAAVDGLTGAMSQSNFLNLSRKEFARSKRFGHDLTVLQLNLDRFRQINEAYGRGAGDHVLKLVARLCLSQLREHDLFGRTGGDEFSILFPETGSDAAIQIAARTRSSIEALVMNWRGQRIRVTSSIGVTLVKGGDLTMKQALSRANSALDAARDAGRNRVLVL